jgi:hypothetical protein
MPEVLLFMTKCMAHQNCHRIINVHPLVSATHPYPTHLYYIYPCYSFKIDCTSRIVFYFSECAVCLFICLFAGHDELVDHHRQALLER